MDERWGLGDNKSQCWGGWHHHAVLCSGNNKVILKKHIFALKLKFKKAENLFKMSACLSTCRKRWREAAAAVTFPCCSNQVSWQVSHSSQTSDETIGANRPDGVIVRLSVLLGNQLLWFFCCVASGFGGECRQRTFQVCHQLGWEHIWNQGSCWDWGWNFRPPREGQWSKHRL